MTKPAIRSPEGSFRTPSYEHATAAEAMRPGVISCLPEATVRQLARPPTRDALTLAAMLADTFDATLVLATVLPHISPLSELDGTRAGRRARLHPDLRPRRGPPRESWRTTTHRAQGNRGRTRRRRPSRSREERGRRPDRDRRLATGAGGASLPGINRRPATGRRGISGHPRPPWLCRPRGHRPPPHRARARRLAGGEARRSRRSGSRPPCVRTAAGLRGARAALGIARGGGLVGLGGDRLCATAPVGLLYRWARRWVASTGRGRTRAAHTPTASTIAK